MPTGLTAYQAWAALGHWVEDQDLLGQSQQMKPLSPRGGGWVSPGLCQRWAWAFGQLWILGWAPLTLPLTPCDGGQWGGGLLGHRCPGGHQTSAGLTLPRPLTRETRPFMVLLCAGFLYQFVVLCWSPLQHTLQKTTSRNVPSLSILKS